jgi:hypothetical protein
MYHNGNTVSEKSPSGLGIIRVLGHMSWVLNNEEELARHVRQLGGVFSAKR